MRVAASLLLIAAGALGAPVTSLPGYDGKLPFASDSGYIAVDSSPHTKHMFYWMVYADGVPAEQAPTVLWLTGGPGCSSLYAFMTEHGPLHNSGNGTLVQNPYSWNKAPANIVYLEAPVGVGYSWAEDGNYSTGDNETARVNLGVLLGLADRFPHIRSNDLYIAGESYAGHYVPQLANAVVQANVANPAKALPLRGWMVGNPSWSFDDGSHYFDFMQLHSIIDRADYRAALATCGGSMAPPRSAACDAALAVLRNQTIGINPYDVIGKCNGKPSLTGGCFTQQAVADAESSRLSRPESSWAEASGPRGLAQTFVPCIDVTPAVDYFGRSDVRAALHVDANAFAWDVCSQHVEYRYYAHTVAPIYADLVPSHRVLVYSGDVDSCVPFPGTQDNVDALGYPLVDGWKPWTVGGQIAGFQRSYAVGAKGSLAWASVRGASHMVPNTKPAEALAMFERFLATGMPA
ncbi:hypothetical protein FNF27_04943 [Cafeteria roenbergensis]|uniref:Carboxypeptidase n=1 Tax=Cafeteria roenbergensis TaxID=33653 RepID=A0A5A8E7Y8_CAFRO|nr:hypothetical protein FNF27_04943 [Cafeteria roenbergensis]